MVRGKYGAGVETGNENLSQMEARVWIKAHSQKRGIIKELTPDPHLRQPRLQFPLKGPLDRTRSVHRIVPGHLTIG